MLPGSPPDRANQTDRAQLLATVPDLDENQLHEMYLGQFLGSLKQSGFLPKEGWLWGNWSPSQWQIAIAWGNLRSIVLADYHAEYRKAKADYDREPRNYARQHGKTPDTPPPITEAERQQKESDVLAFQNNLAALFEGINNVQS